MKLLFSLASLILCFLSIGQNQYPYGEFTIRNIDRTEYKAGVQNWDIIQNHDNFFYVANNSGILEFNGEQWTKFDLENGEHPRSFAENDKGEIFVGGQGEFGKITYNERGRPVCQKLSAEVDSLEFKDIWRVFCIEEKTYFVARKYIFILDSSGIEAISTPEGGNIKQSERIRNEIICTTNDDDNRLSYVLRGNKFIKIKFSEGVFPTGFVTNADSTFLIDEKGQYYDLMISGNNYKFERSNKKLKRNNNSFKIDNIVANDRLIVAAVHGEGVEIFDLDGNFIRGIGESEGLSNSIVHKTLFDQYNNLWLGTDNGITFVEISSSITSYNKKLGVSAGITEDLDFYGDKIILATHSDIFSSKIVNGKLTFESTPVFGIDTWQIRDFTFSDGLTVKLVIANDGIYSIDQNFVKSNVAKYVYAWDLSQSTSDPDRIFVGLDGDGVGSLYYKAGKFKYEGNYPNTSGDVRAVQELDGKVYYTVKYEGVHLLDTTKSQSQNMLVGLQEFEDPSSNYEQFTLELFQNKIYVGTAHGLYEIVDNKLIPSPIEGGKFCEEKLLIHRIINDDDDKLWLVMFHDSESDDERAEMGYLTNSDGQLKWYSSRFNQIKDDVVFSIKKAANGIYWFGGVKAVYSYNEKTITNYDNPFQVFISGVYLNEEEEFLYHTKYSQLEKNLIDYSNNSIRFEFGANSYLGGIQNEYSYYLEGEEEAWSKWKSTPHTEYQRLREGDYILHLKAKNFYGFESEETTFAFTISPPWFRTWWAYLIYIGLFILLIYVVIRLSIRRVKAQNIRLEEIVEQRTAEIAEQNHQLEHQKAEIQEKTNDIVDSIKYAERIQTAILPTDDSMSKIFDGEHFVLYMPKDIVSGDFYWADRFDSQAIFSAVDCTGHGVPGAFVSIVGFNNLNRTVNEFNLREPGLILDKLTELVVETFAKSESSIKDGMDIALCNINYETNVLSYAGANNPLVIIRDGEMTEIKANKQPIGEFHHRVPFTTHQFELKKGDCIYVFSDGFADQFGGEKGKKFKGKALKELLLTIYNLPMQEQRLKLLLAFEQWKGEFEQLDDVCLFGVKI